MRVHLDSIGPHESLYLSTNETEAAWSCLGRLLAERARGLRTLIVIAAKGLRPGNFEAAFERLGADYLPLDPPLPPSTSLAGNSSCPESSLRAVSVFLEEIRRRTQPRHVYLPLGVGGRLAERTLHEAGLWTFLGGERRLADDIFLYEERPAALIPGAVRLRLAHLAASLPPGAARVSGASPLRLVLGFQRAPHLSFSGLGDRSRSALLLLNQWAAARAWNSQKAFGPRLQPRLQEVDPSAAEIAALLFGGLPARLRSRAARGAARYSRSLGGSSMERYWLLLPEREPLTGGSASTVAEPPI